MRVDFCLFAGFASGSALCTARPLTWGQAPKGMVKVDALRNLQNLEGAVDLDHPGSGGSEATFPGPGG